MATLLFDQSTRTKLELRGRDRAVFLNNFCTNDVSHLAAGFGCEAFLTNGQAKILARMLIFALPDALWVDADPGLAEKVIAHLSRYQISEDVDFSDRSAAMAQWQLLGALADGPSNLGELQVTGWSLNGVACQLRRNDALGSEGYDVLCLAEQKESAQNALLARGATLGACEQYESLRIEAGTPVYGRDIDESNLPQEVNRDDRAISYTKGCYLGQETVARIHALGHVNRLLVGVTSPDAASLAEGAELRHGGNVVGHVTSAAKSPRLACMVGLAYVRREQAKPGTLLEVVTAGGRADAQVVTLPIIRRIEE